MRSWPAARTARVGAYVLAGFVAGSLLTGAAESTPFTTNLDYGVRTGFPAALIAGGLVWVYALTGSRRRSTAATLRGPTPETLARPVTKEATNMTSKATFGAGCFWGVESTFRQVPGVTATAVGYSGGHTDNPSYRQVCSHGTGHAEVVEVAYDPDRVSYEELLDVFWANHNPTTKNRQGPDIGDQYRSVIFYHDEAQRAAAEASKKALESSGRWRKPVVTEIEPAPTFWRAEDYHQQYFEKQGLAPTCHL